MPGHDALVWLAEVPFNGAPHRQQHLARLLADRYQVLYVEPPPPMRAPSYGVVWHDGIAVGQAAPLLNAHPLFGALRSWPVRRAAEVLGRLQVRALVRAAGLDHSTGLTVVCSNVYLIGAASMAHRRRLVTDICDDPRHYPGEPPWSDALLRRAVLKAQLVTTSSRWLEAEFRQWGARHLEYIPNGIHQRLLDARPVRRTADEKAVLGFVGHLGPWVDFGLLTRIARACPDATLDLVGSVAPEIRDLLEELRREPNVRYTPQVPYANVPNVLARFSVGLIPFEVSHYTRAVNPIKLYEYAAFDLPIVTTAFSPDVIALSDRIDVCGSVEQFVRRAGELGGGAPAPSTRAIADAHTWERVADAFADAIDASARTLW